MTISFTCLCLLLTLTNAFGTKPNIVFILVDDWGYSDVGFRNPVVLTPNFNDMVKNGLLLDRHYVFKYCSPSRASLLTGRWPHHAHQWNPNPPMITGANINMTMLPAKLKTAGYKSHLIGKWHEGVYDPAFLPVNRGFDSSTGFLWGSEDHFTEKTSCAIDFWKNTDPYTKNGSYSAYIYRDDLTMLFDSHDQSDSLFLYLPLQNVHSPIQAPDEWIDKYRENSTCSKRRTLQAMVSVADNITGHVVELLKKKEMWDNTIIVVSADNGGAQCEGSNYPLRGSKHSFFEGGVRVNAFASGGLIPEKMRGKSTQGFIHIADWYTTFCKLAGVDASDSGPGKFPVDGMDIWPIINGETDKTPHDEIVLGYNFEDTHLGQGAIIAGNYKLIVGAQDSGCDTNRWTSMDYPCSDGELADDCRDYCLFDIVKDPEERKDLSKSEPDVMKMMLERYNRYSKEPREMQDQGYHSQADVPSDKNACTYMAEHGGYWRPWKPQ